MNYDVVITKLSDDDGGGYLGLVPDLYGCMSDGETPEEALANTKAAIADWLEANKAMGRPEPSPGEARERARIREESLIHTIEVMAEKYDNLDDRIVGLHQKMDEILERIEEDGAWARIAQVPLLEKKSALLVYRS